MPAPRLHIMNAAIQERFSFAGSEQQAEYVEIARGRVAKIMPHSEVLLNNPELVEEPAIRNAS